MSLGKEPGRLQRPRQRIRARHRYFQHSAPGEIYELTADAIAKTGTVRCRADDPTQSFRAGATRRCDRDDALPVGDELQRHVDRFVGAHGIQRCGELTAGSITRTVGESFAIHDRGAPESAHLVESGLTCGTDDVNAAVRGLLQHADADGP